MNTFKLICYGIFGIVAVAGIAQAGTALTLWSLAFWGPQCEEARRTIDTQSERRVQGVSQNIMAQCTQMRLTDDNNTARVYANLIITADGRSDTPITPEAKSCVREAKTTLGL